MKLKKKIGIQLIGNLRNKRCSTNYDYERVTK